MSAEEYECIGFPEAFLNIHENVRAKPSSWIVAAWMPEIDEKKKAAVPAHEHPQAHTKDHLSISGYKF
jgi:hypothetical protein